MPVAEQVIPEQSDFMEQMFDETLLSARVIVEQASDRVVGASLRLNPRPRGTVPLEGGLDGGGLDGGGLIGGGGAGGGVEEICPEMVK
ncbi:hypothetical protein HK102_002841 [Quaeritorhiza haematococci]|nr:hypothetical protein HK102_002841 [Quaeritorhiza haematococci]